MLLKISAATEHRCPFLQALAGSLIKDHKALTLRAPSRAVLMAGRR